MSKRWKQTGIVIAIAAAFAFPAKADDDPDQFALSPEQLLNATVVSVSKTSEKLMDAPAAIYVLTHDEIIRSGAASVPEALREVPGVEVARVNANSRAISVRGFDNHIRVSLNIDAVNAAQLRVEDRLLKLVTVTQESPGEGR